MAYQWDAADYERHSSPQQQWAHDVIGSLKLAGNERAIDVGCSHGKVTAELAARLPNGSVLELIALKP